MTHWESINTVPKDGRRLLTANCNEVRENSWYDFDVTKADPDNDYHKWLYEPRSGQWTHWANLPVLPSSEATK